MAIVNLASFEIDASKVQQEVDNLTKKLFELGNQQKDLGKQSKELQKSIDELAKSENADAAATEELKKKQFELYKAQLETAKQTQSVKAEYNNLTKVKKETIKVEVEELSMAQKLKAAFDAEVKTIEQARKSNSEMIKLRNQLNPEIEEEANLLTQLNTKIDQNNNFIKQNSSALEKQKINVGNYTDSIIEAYKEMDKQKKELESLNDELQVMRDSTEEGTEEWKIFNQQINNNNTQINILVTDMGRAKGEFNDLNDVVGLTSGGLGGFIEASSKAGGSGKLIASAGSAAATGMWGLVKSSIAFIATPIGAILAAIVVVLALVKNAMNSNAESANKVMGIFSAFGAIVKSLLKVLEPLGTFLIDSIVAGFELAGKAAEAAMGMLSDALAFLGFDDAAASVTKFTSETKEAAKSAMALAQAEADLEKAQRDSQKIMLTYQNEAEKLRQIRDDDSLSIADRIKANDALGAKLKEQMTIEKALAEQALEVAKMRLLAARSVEEEKEALDKIAEAETNIIDIEERITGQLSEQLTNRNSLLKEAADKRKEIADKAYEAALKKMQEELDYFVESQGFREKTLEESLKIAQDVAKRETAILDLQLKNQKISRQAYATELLKIQNDLAKQSAEITVENARLELEAYMELNNAKYLEKARIDTELYNKEATRLTDELAMQKQFLDLQFEQGVISKTELNEKMIELDRSYEEQRQAVSDEFYLKKQEDEAVKTQLEREAKLLQINDDAWGAFETEKIVNEAAKAEEVATIAQQYQDGLINEENYQIALKNIDEKYKKKGEDIEEKQSEFKLETASQTAGNLATILGKESAAGKAAAIAQTTIDTYKSATAAYSSMAGIPVVGPALGAAAAGAAVVSGLKTVKEITKTKVEGGGGALQGLVTGGIVGDGFEIQRDNGDDRLVTLQTGEAVLSRASRAYLGDEILAGAGMPLSGAASSTISSGNMTEQIAIAVERGAARGSEVGSSSGAAKGLIGLSDNRNIANSATF